MATVAAEARTTVVADAVPDPPAVPIPSDKDAPATRTPVTTAVLEERLQLIQLCFGEHEFGVVLQDENAGDAIKAETGQAGVDTLDFDAASFVEKKLSNGVALEALGGDIDTFVAHIERRLQQLVNTDLYASFINVSGHLVGMQEELECLQPPLTTALQEANAARDYIVHLQAEVAAKLQQACEAEVEHVFDAGFLKLLLLYEKFVDTSGSLRLPAVVDASLCEDCPRPDSQSVRGAAPHGDTASSDADQAATGEPVLPSTYLSELGVAVNTVVQLSALAAALPGDTLLPQRRRARDEAARLVEHANRAVLDLLQGVTGTLCTAVLATQPAAPGTALRGAGQLRDVVGMYSRLDALDALATVARTTVVRPFLERVLSWKAATQARQSVDETVKLLSRVEDALAARLLPLLEHLRHATSSAAAQPARSTLYPVAQILWPVLSDMLMLKLVLLYEIGIPDTFQRKCVAAYRLLALAETACATPEELVLLRRSAEMVLWNHKWNVDVYAALRLAEFDKPVTAALDVLQPDIVMEDTRNGPPPGAAASVVAPPVGYAIHAFAVLEDRLRWLFSRDVFLYVCAPRFLRHVATSCQRVADEVMRQREADAHGSPNSPQWAAGGEAALRFYFAFASDLRQLSRFVAGPLRELVLDACLASRDNVGTQANITVAEDGGVAVQAARLPSTRRCGEDVDRVLHYVASVMCERYATRAEDLVLQRTLSECTAALQNVKSVRSAYSHTRKATPTEVSWYVQSVLDPIVRLAREVERAATRRSAQTVAVTDSSAQQCVIALIDQVIVLFTTLAHETLVTAKRTEESWEKLRRRKEGGATAAAVDVASPHDKEHEPGLGAPREGVGDRDKMLLQLYIDANQLLRGLREAMGAWATPSPDVTQSLLSLLRRAEWLQGAAIPEPPDVE